MNPDGDNVNECTLFATITSADNSTAIFRRATRYAMNFINNTANTTLMKGFNASKSIWDKVINWNDYYSKILHQRKDPILIIRATSATSSKFTIGPTTSSQAAISSSSPYDLVFYGKYDQSAGKTRQRNTDNSSNRFITKTITYVCTGAGSGNAFTIKSGTGEGAPVFSSSNQSDSDWSNSNPRYNSGTKISIFCNPITNKGVLIDNSGSTNYCTITLELTIDKWGRKDVLMAMDLDGIFSVS